MNNKLPIKIMVNRAILMEFTNGPTTVNTVLNELKVDGNSMAVAVNNDIVPKKNWELCVLNDGDNVNVFGAIAGG